MCTLVFPPWQPYPISHAGNPGTNGYGTWPTWSGATGDDWTWLLAPRNSSWCGRRWRRGGQTPSGKWGGGCSERACKGNEDHRPTRSLSLQVDKTIRELQAMIDSADPAIYRSQEACAGAGGQLSGPGTPNVSMRRAGLRCCVGAWLRALQLAWVGRAPYGGRPPSAMRLARPARAGRAPRPGLGRPGAAPCRAKGNPPTRLARVRVAVTCGALDPGLQELYLHPDLLRQRGVGEPALSPPPHRHFRHRAPPDRGWTASSREGAPPGGPQVRGAPTASTSGIAPGDSRGPACSPTPGAWQPGEPGLPASAAGRQRSKQLPHQITPPSPLPLQPMHA